MPLFLIAAIAVAAATLAGNPALRMARLSAAHARGSALLAAGWLACAVGGGMAAALGAGLADRLRPALADGVAAAALMAGAAVLALRRPARAPAEPTRSFGATALVLGAGQAVGAGGMVTLALAAVLGQPLFVGLASALGAMAALTAAWIAGPDWERAPLGAVRYTVAGLLAAAALVTAVAAGAPGG